MGKIIHLQNSIVGYDDVGEGKVVVLLHGFGEDKEIWKNQISFLQNHYRIIAPDLPGTNSSTNLDDAVSIDGFANWLHQFLVEVLNSNFRDIILLGHSMGGYVTLSFAKQFQHQLKAFGLLHSTAFADSDEKKEVRKRGVELIKNFGAYSFLKNTVPNLFAKIFKEKHIDQVNELIEKGKCFSEKSLTQYLVAMMNREDSTSILKNSTLPILFIMGTEDVAAPMQDVLQQCHLPPKSYVHILENVGHMGMIEATDEMNKIIENFLKQVING